jgi:Kef-type K+ transport system membrane component KefB
MPVLAFTNLALLAAVAFAVPLLLGLAPRLHVPAAVLEIVAGIIIGPSVLGWVRVDTPIAVLALIGLAFLLFLAGLEIEPERLRGPILRVVVLAFALGFVVALVIGFGLGRLGVVKSPLLIAIILVSTGLGVLVPILKDAGESATSFGQLVIAAASLADFGSVVLLSLFFSRETASQATQIALLVSFGLLAGAVTLGVLRAGRSSRLAAVLLRLQDTTAQIRVRAAFLLLVAFVALAARLGLEAILGAFTAGVLLRLVDRDAMTHPNFRLKLEAVGFGVFIPVFFVATGLQFNAAALFASPATLLRVPLFLAALLLVHGVPALLYRQLVGGRRVLPAGLLGATTLTFLVAAEQIGTDLGLITPANGAALIAAGLLSVLLFPLLALTLLRSDGVTRSLAKVKG